MRCYFARLLTISQPSPACLPLLLLLSLLPASSSSAVAYTIQLMIARALSSKLRSARLSQQITVNQKGGQSQPMLDAPLRSPEEQKLYATCFEGLGVTQDQFTRIVSCFRRFVCSKECAKKRKEKEKRK